MNGVGILHDGARELRALSHVSPIIIETKKEHLSAETVLSKTTEYQIYRYYLGRDFTPNKAVRSPFHKDRQPSFLIGTKGGFYYHTDFSNDMYRGNCFHFVMQMLKVDYNTALHKIDEDLHLGITNTQTTTPKVTFTEPDATAKWQSTIQVIPKKFTQKELGYWGSYYIGESELRAENVYSVEKVYLDKSRIALGNNEMTFGYLYEERYWKIYRPFDTRMKWVSSVPLQVVDGLENIRSCRKAVVCKAKKDKMIMSYFTSACAVQNESLAAFSEDTVTWLNGEASQVYVAFDSDEPGVRTSWQVTKQFGWRHLNVPYSYLEEGIKDFSDLCKKHGLKKVQEYLKEKQIL